MQVSTLSKQLQVKTNTVRYYTRIVHAIFDLFLSIVIYKGRWPNWRTLFFLNINMVVNVRVITIVL